MTRPTLHQWVMGARPQTLPLSIAPVLLGVAVVADATNDWLQYWPTIILCFLVAIFLQVGVNYANDYSDGVKGTDKKRVGPLRLVGSGIATPKSVLTAALICLGIAAVFGLLIILLTQQWWLLAVGAACLVAAWFYTGGKQPYGYLPFGEFMVILFFGLVPTLGTMYVQLDFVTSDAWLAGAAAGFFAAGVLMANNLRDREKDAVHNKRTLSVFIGAKASRYVYSSFVLLPFLFLVRFVGHYPAAILVYAVLLFVTIPTIIAVWQAKTPPQLVQVLRRTVLMALAYSLGLTTVILLS